MPNYLVDLYKDKRVNRLTEFSKNAQALEADRLADGYAKFETAHLRWA